MIDKGFKKSEVICVCICEIVEVYLGGIIDAAHVAKFKFFAAALRNELGGDRSNAHRRQT